MTTSETAGRTGDGEVSEKGTGKLDRNYWRLWWANGVNSVGNGAFAAALPLLATTVTQDPREISLIAAVTFLPWLLLSLPAGVLIDRYDRVTLMWTCQAVQALVVVAIAVWAAMGVTSIPLLVVTSFLLGSAEVVIKNAAQSILPQYVPPFLLHKANGNRQVVENLGESTFGPPLGSILFVMAAALPFGLDAVSFAVSAALLARLPRRRLERAKRQSIGREIAEGLRWLRKHKLLRLLAVMLGMNTFANQMGFSTLVLFATQTLHVSSHGYGLMLLGVGVGGALGGLVNARIAKKLGVIPALVASYAANALIYVAMGLAPSGVGLAVLMGACGFALTITGVVTISLRQQIIPGELMGRVNSVYRMVGWGLMPVGSLVGGFTAEEFGLRAPMIGAGGVRILVLLLVGPALLAGARQLQGGVNRAA